MDSGPLPQLCGAGPKRSRRFSVIYRTNLEKQCGWTLLCSQEHVQAKRQEPALPTFPGSKAGAVVASSPYALRGTLV